VDVDNRLEHDAEVLRRTSFHGAIRRSLSLGTGIGSDGSIGSKRRLRSPSRSRRSVTLDIASVSGVVSAPAHKAPTYKLPSAAFSATKTKVEPVRILRGSVSPQCRVGFFVE